MCQKGLVTIIVVILIAAAVGGYLVYSGKINSPLRQDSAGQVNQIKPSPAYRRPPDATTMSKSQNDETANWKTYTGETVYTTDGSSVFTIKYPGEWLLEGNKLYPVGKSDEAFSIKLGAGGRGGPPAQEEKKLPAGVAKYYWSKNNIAAGGYATFNIDGKSYIFEITVPVNKSDEYEKIFNQMLKTFKP